MKWDWLSQSIFKSEKSFCYPAFSFLLDFYFFPSSITIWPHSFHIVLCNLENNVYIIDGISNVLYKNLINFGCAQSSLQHACWVVASGILVPLARDGTCAPWGSAELIQWTTREIPGIYFKMGNIEINWSLWQYYMFAVCLYALSLTGVVRL